MKKKLLLSCFILLGFTTFGQLMNGDFESWSTVQFEFPNTWETSNSENYENGLGFGATKVSPGFNGSYAIRLETKGSSMNKIAGYCINSMGDPMEGKGGAPYTMQPDSFIFNAKLGILSGDSGIFLVFFKKQGAIISQSLGKFVGNDPDTWKRLAFKLQPIPVIPDTVIIGIACSDAFEESNMKIGSFIVVDNVRFTTSQAIANSGFEEWTSQSFDEPDEWNSYNYNLAIKGKEYVEQTSDAYAGTSACKITTAYDADYQHYFNEISNGNYKQLSWEGGFPYSEMKDTLMGWYKYMPNLVDTANVNIVFKKNGTEIWWAGTILMPSASYTKFEIPLDLPSVPDTAMIQIASSNWPLAMSNVGSVLIIDELQFKSDLLTTRIPDVQTKAKFDIFPNPANEGFYILRKSLSEPIRNYVVLDYSGRLLKQGQCFDDKTYIDVKGMAAGLYFVRVNDKNETETKKIMIR